MISMCVMYMSEMAQVDKVIFPFDQAVRHLLIRSAAKKKGKYELLKHGLNIS